MKISSLDIQKTNKAQQTSFSGLRRTYDKNLEDVYRFSAPPIDKSKYALVIEMCEVRRDENGKHYVSVKPFVYNDSYKHLRDSGICDLSRDYEFTEPEETIIDEKTGNPVTRDKFIGYRFKVVDKLAANKITRDADLPVADYDSPFNDLKQEYYIYDPGSIVHDEKYGDFTVLSNKMGMTPKSGAAYHAYYDSDTSSPNIDKKVFVRNHFNKAGGDLDDITKHPKELEPYNYVMSNPYIGDDKRSSHKYWGQEFYKVPSIAVFKNVITDLFKEGKGYIADGAITSQSIQSPMFQDVLKYGKNSQFYDWFKINGRIKLGVLPDDNDNKSTNPRRAKAMDHIGFKIVNPKGVKGYDYDPKKPSYIQFFDDRLASAKQRNDVENLIDSYDTPNPEDHFEITTHEDSVIPFSFELDYSDSSVLKRFSGYKNKMLKDITDELDTFLAFKNYDITTKRNAGGANFWDGNTDIVKMNISNPNTDPKNIEGSERIREHLYGVATHWTQFANDSLFEYLADCFANNKSEEIADIATKNDIKPDELDSLLKLATNEEAKSNEPSVNAKSTITEIIDNFHFESLDTSPQVAAVFASPAFNEIFKSEAAKNKLFNYVIEALKGFNDCTQEPIIDPSSEVTDILTLETANSDELNDSIKLTPYGKYLAQLLSNKIISYAALKALSPKDNVTIDKDGLIKDTGKHKGLSLEGLGVLPSGDPKDEAQQLAKIMLKRLSSEKARFSQRSDIINQLSQSQYADFSFNDLRQADFLLKKSGGGLNWRFDASKDVADLNSNKNGIITMEDSLNDMTSFWGEFVKNIRNINPSSYVVAEVTDLWSYYNSDIYEVEARKIIGKQILRMERAGKLEEFAKETLIQDGQNEAGITKEMLNARIQDLKDFRDKIYVRNVERQDIPQFINKLIDKKTPEVKAEDWGEYRDPDTAERIIYEKTGATTGSNYSTFFNQFPNMFGQNFEHGNINDYFFANMESLRDSMDKYLKSGPLLYLTHSHIFVDNHDKPRALHCLALDMGAYLSDFGIGGDQSTTAEDIQRAKDAAIRVLGKEPQNYDGVSSKAMVVGDVLINNFEKVLALRPDILNIVKEAVRDLSVGKFKTQVNWDYLRAKSFGQNSFDISINDVMEQAKYLAERDGKSWVSAREEKKISSGVFKELMEPALQKMEKMTDVMSAVTGIPFMYMGDNMGATGYEEASKNIAVANRNLIRREWIDPDSDEFKPEIKEYYDRMQAGIGLYKEYGLSAIAGGMPISMPQENGRDLYAIMKYDDKGSKVIQVVSNVGMTKDPYSKMDEEAFIEVPSIAVQDADKHNLPICENEKDPKADNFMYRKVYNSKKRKFVDEKDNNGISVKYIIKDGQMRRADGKMIKIDDSVSTFYKPLGLSKVTNKEIMMKHYAA